MGVYANKNLLDWFVAAYEKLPSKIDMGKGCIRFKKIEEIPFDLIGELAKKIDVQAWIEMIETNTAKAAETRKASSKK